MLLILLVGWLVSTWGRSFLSNSFGARHGCFWKVFFFFFLRLGKEMLVFFWEHQEICFVVQRKRLSRANNEIFSTISKRKTDDIELKNKTSKKPSKRSTSGPADRNIT